jgi:hypothetical protein
MQNNTFNGNAPDNLDNLYHVQSAIRREQKFDDKQTQQTTNGSQQFNLKLLLFIPRI